MNAKIGIERERSHTAIEWLDQRITKLEGKVVLWGAIPTVAVAVAAILAYLRK